MINEVIIADSSLLSLQSRYLRYKTTIKNISAITCVCDSHILYTVAAQLNRMSSSHSRGQPASLSSVQVIIMPRDQVPYFFLNLIKNSYG
jgi:hypothetical protein